MALKRRTFHVDWDSPSHETGTIKRRPASLTMSASFLASTSNNHFKNVEHEFRDCIADYDLRHQSTRSKSIHENSSATENVYEIKDERSAIVKGNRNCSKYPQSNYPRKKNTPGGWVGGPEKFKTSAPAKQALVNEQELSQQHSRNFRIGERKDFIDSYVEKTRNFHIEKEIKDKTDKRFENVEGICLHDLFSEEVGVKKDFDLKLYCESFEWKSTVSRMTKIRRSKSLKFRSLIPRPTVVRSCTTRGLVSSSSESSGFGSPLSPLSPHQDPSIGTSTLKDIIKTSDSKSSGLGSPESPSSPLSPESQKYSAFCLIQLQLEKLRNCTCEKRQAEVI